VGNRDVLAIGASAGGFDGLRLLAREFAKDLPASVLIVLHLSSEFRSELDAILTRSGPLQATFAREREILELSHIYIAPPGSHLLLDNDELLLGAGPPENNARPAIDPLFRSAALCCAARTIGVVLSGTLDDGASGLWSLKQSGGVTVVQDPADAAFPEMPISAINRSKPDYLVGLAGMPALLDELVRLPAGPRLPVSAEIKYEVAIARGERGNMSDMDRIGRRSFLACPECHGVMWEIEEGELVRYRCHVGHAYTAELMSVALDDNLRRALANGLRAVEERSALARGLQKQAAASGRDHAAASWARRLRAFEEEEESLRSAIRRVDRIAARFQQ
jgi:two-component system, chemotaxis family, protein-glutamate methylesterase/glutaminase